MMKDERPWPWKRDDVGNWYLPLPEEGLPCQDCGYRMDTIIHGRARCHGTFKSRNPFVIRRAT